MMPSFLRYGLFMSVLLSLMIACTTVPSKTIPCEQASSTVDLNYKYINQDGYREKYYIGAVPTNVPEGCVLTTSSLLNLLQTKKNVILIDVMRLSRRTEKEGLDEEWIENKPRNNLPGSIWLPNVGLGAIEKETNGYFHGALRELTGGDYDHTLVFYCNAHCWMSWNAVRRAASYGYRKLYWYPGGVDEWLEKVGSSTAASPYRIGH